MQGLSPKLPLSYNARDSFYVLNHNVKELMAQNLKHLILTSPGERMMMPDFGVGLKRYLFLSEREVKEGLSSKISEQVERYLPFIKIININFSGLDDDQLTNFISIKIHYTIESLGSVEVIDVSSEMN